jgi:hypothetical protein
VDYRQLEGVLYAHAGDDARPSRSTFVPRSRPPGPRSLTHRSMQRVDVAIAMERNLTPAEVQMVKEHYGGKTRHPKREVRRVVKKLVVALTED